MTIWEKPSFEELAMNAEIGAYQADDDNRDNRPFIELASAPHEAAEPPPILD